MRNLRFPNITFGILYIGTTTTLKYLLNTLQTGYRIHLPGYSHTPCLFCGEGRGRGLSQMEMIIISSSKISYFSEFGGTGSYVTNRRNFLNYFCYLSPVRHCQPMLNVPKIYIFICNNSLFAHKHTATIYTSPLLCSVCSPQQLLLAFFMLFELNNYLLSLVRRQRQRKT